MTVPAQTPINESAANGVTTVFPYTFLITASSELLVQVDGVTKTLGVDYTVSGVGNNAGGNVTFTVAPANGTTVTRRRNMPLERNTGYTTSGDLKASVLNNDHDRHWLALQQLNALVGKSIQMPPGVTGGALPEPEANAPLVWNPTGTALENGDLSVVGDLTLRGHLADTGASKGTELVSHVQPLTGGVARTVAAKLSEQISVEDFGAVGDGVADDTAAIQAAEDAVAAAGGSKLLFKSTRYKITATLYKRTSNILWRGRGEGHQHDAGSGIDAGTALVWAGAAGGTMIYFAPTEGASNRRISGGGIVGIGLYGNDVAARGLDMRSVNNAKVDIYADAFTGTCMYMGVVTTLGEARDAQQNDVRLLFQQVGASSGKGLILDGDTTANTSCNKIHFRGAYKFATALELVNCDNNLIYCWVFRFGGGTALGVDILGGASAAVTARANTFEYLLTHDGGVRIRGTSDGYAAPAVRNRFLMWDNENVQPMPTVGTGCDYFMIDHDGTVRWTEVYGQRVAANAFDWKGNTDKILLRMNWTSGTADSYWEMRHAAGSVNIRANSDTASDVTLNILTKGAGIGALVGGNFASDAFRWRHNGAAQLAFYGTAPVSKPTVTGAKGGNAALASLMTALSTLGLVTDSTT